jgi:hypothetical protein
MTAVVGSKSLLCFQMYQILATWIIYIYNMLYSMADKMHCININFIKAPKLSSFKFLIELIISVASRSLLIHCKQILQFKTCLQFYL